MNPFNNRWVALFVVVGFLLVVAELVGTGGVLSQTAQSHSAAGEPVEPPHADVAAAPPTVIEDVPEDVPEEDMPQIVTDDDVDDTDLSAVDNFPEPEMAENDGSGDEL
jgi:hypothetical protein